MSRRDDGPQSKTFLPGGTNRGSWLTSLVWRSERTGEEFSWKRNRYRPPKITGAPPQLQLVPPWTMNPDLTSSIKTSLSLCDCRVSHPSPSIFLLTLSFPRESPFKELSSTSGQLRETAEKGRSNCYCTCCSGNNLEINHAFFETLEAPTSFSLFLSLYLWGRCGVTLN